MKERSMTATSLTPKLLPRSGVLRLRGSLALGTAQASRRRDPNVEQLSQPPPFPTHLEPSGPVPTAPCSIQELSSPLRSRPAEPVSAGIDLALTDGTLYGNQAASSAMGFQQDWAR